MACDFPDPDNPVNTTNLDVTAVRAARLAA
jgi:hypothetical protein